ASEANWDASTPAGRRPESSSGSGLQIPPRETAFNRFAGPRPERRGSMSAHRAILRPFFAFLFCAGLFLAASPRLSAQDCPSDLQETSGFTILTNGTPANAQKGVEEWDGETVKFHTDLPGVLEINGAGDGSQSSLYAKDDEESQFVDSARLGTDLRDLQAVAPAGDYCVQVRPPAGAEGDFTLVVGFTDVCHLGAVDDHGDSFLCATPIEVDGSDEGEIDSTPTGDVDVFTFTLESAATV